MFEERMAGSSEALEALNRAQVFQGQAVDTSKLGMEQGQTASVVTDLDRGTFTGHNDGDPNHYMVKGNTVTRQGVRQEYQYPVKGYPVGASWTNHRTPAELHLREFNHMNDVKRGNFWYRN